MAWKAGTFSGSLRDLATDIRGEWAEDVSAGVTAATKGLQSDLRAQVVRADLGQRMSNAVGSRIYPASAASLGAAGVVFPRGNKAVEIFDSFNQGSVIRAKNGATYLALPTPAAGRPGGRRPTPAQIEAQGIKLASVKTKRPGVLVLVGEQRGGRKRAAAQRVVYFVLVRQTKEARSLSFEASARAWADRIPALIGGA